MNVPGSISHLTPTKALGRLVIPTTVVTVGLLGVCAFLRPAGEVAPGWQGWVVPAMYAVACAWLGSVSASMAPAMMIRRPAQDVAAAALLGLGLRFGVTLAAGLACRPLVDGARADGLLIAVGVAQLVYLTIDAVVLARLVQSRFPVRGGVAPVEARPA